MSADATPVQDRLDRMSGTLASVAPASSSAAAQHVQPSSDLAPQSASEDALACIRQEIHEEYAEPHGKPWIVGYSGGKDSTLVAHLVVEHLLSLPRSERTRAVHVVANDTLVESPVVMEHVRIGLAEIEKEIGRASCRERV